MRLYKKKKFSSGPILGIVLFVVCFVFFYVAIVNVSSDVSAITISAPVKEATSKVTVSGGKDLKVGMELQGTVRNVVDFGAFVDIGVKQDGLVHISKLKKGHVKHPLDVISLGDIVTVWIDSVDVKKGRIALTMIGPVNN